jgi:hypothetical protein
LRLRDYDRAGGRLRFHEKGAKTIWKPVPDELAALLEAAIADGVIRDPDDYLIPPEGPLSRAGDRDDRVIWRVVKRVAASVGVEAHTHALRAAFATFYLEQNPGELVTIYHGDALDVIADLDVSSTPSSPIRRTRAARAWRRRSRAAARCSARAGSPTDRSTSTR